MIASDIGIRCIYPEVMGTEQETSVSYPGQGGGQIPVEHQSDALTRYKFFGQDKMVYAGAFDTGGAKVYFDDSHLEHATAECSSLDQLVPRIQGVELLLEGVAKQIVQHKDRPKRVGINRRVVDALGNSFGCHDNFGYSYTDGEGKGGRGAALLGKVQNFMIGHLLTRGFVTGAGYVRAGEYLFSQKMDDIDEITSHARNCSLMRYNDCDQGVRIEIRCNDVNISPWATRMRLGSAAIALAVAQTHLVEQFDELDESMDSIRTMASRYNQCPISPDGKIGDWSDIEDQIAFQSKMARVFLSKEMKRYGKRPEELEEVARELLEYCDDMKLVLKGEESYKILTDRADWAAKLDVIDRSMRRDRAKDIERWMGDMQSRKDDIAYDYIDVRLDENGVPIVKKAGPGYQLRDKYNHFRMSFTPDEVAEATYTAPPNTRAALRAYLIQNYRVGTCNWNSVSIQSPGLLYSANVVLPSVRAFQLSGDQQEQIEELLAKAS